MSILSRLVTHYCANSFRFRIWHYERSICSNQCPGRLRWPRYCGVATGRWRFSIIFRHIGSYHTLLHHAPYQLERDFLLRRRSTKLPSYCHHHTFTFDCIPPGKLLKHSYARWFFIFIIYLIFNKLLIVICPNADPVELESFVLGYDSAKLHSLSDKCMASVPKCWRCDQVRWIEKTSSAASHLERDRLIEILTVAVNLYASVYTKLLLYCEGYKLFNKF